MNNLPLFLTTHKSQTNPKGIPKCFACLLYTSIFPTLGSGLANALSGTSYASEDTDLLGVDEDYTCLLYTSWVDAIQEYADITELDAATLNRLIKEIVVHEHIDSDKTRHISIEIHFNLKPIPEVEQVTA